MSVLFDAAADRLVRTTDLLNYNAAYTVMCWLRCNSFASFRSPGSLGSSAVSFQQYDFYGITNSPAGQTYIACYDGTDFQDGLGSTLSLDTWYHFAWVRSSLSNFILRINGGAADITLTADMTGRAAVAALHLGSSLDGSFLSGDMAAIKAWSAALTQAEIQAEINIIRPARTDNLYGWWPCFPGSTERLADYSGNGRSWTEGGTLTDSDPPPVSYGAPIWYPPAAGGRTTRNTDIRPLGINAGISRRVNIP